VIGFPPKTHFPFSFVAPAFIIASEINFSARLGLYLKPNASTISITLGYSGE
jgi:hypothetical protein